MKTQQNDQIFLDILEANKGLIYKVARSYCPSEEDQKDLIQEIILQLWKSFSRYDDRYKISTWMYRIALNVAISFYRKEKTRKAKSHLTEQSAIIGFGQEVSPQKEERLDLLMQFISELKEMDKAIILLYLEEKDQKEIAEILGISTSNVSTKIYRIKKQLAKQFANQKSQ